jgi:hypothetical protein
LKLSGIYFALETGVLKQDVIKAEAVTSHLHVTLKHTGLNQKKEHG